MLISGSPIDHHFGSPEEEFLPLGPWSRNTDIAHRYVETHGNGRIAIWFRRLIFHPGRNPFRTDRTRWSNPSP